MESSPSFDGSIQIPTTLPDSPLLSLVPRHPVTTDTNEHRHHKILKKMVMQHRLVSERKVTTGRDDPPPPPPQPPAERALDEIRSSMRCLDESSRHCQELLAHIHELSTPQKTEDPVTLLIADLIDDFDGSH